MEKNRLEAFSDGVIAIIITIMVLEMKVPHGAEFAALTALLPFSTGWMGENHFERWPTVLYGVNLLLCALAYYVLQQLLIRHQGPQGLLAQAVAGDVKGKTSPLLYVAGASELRG